MNSRLSTRNAKAFAGSCAFACAQVPLPAGLPLAQAPGHRESEDRSHPGDSRV